MTMTDKNQLRIDDKTLPEIRKIVYDLEAECMDSIQSKISEVLNKTGLIVEGVTVSTTKNGFVSNVQFNIDFRRDLYGTD